MLKRFTPFVALLVAFSVASADAAQRNRRAKPEPPPPPPQFKVDVATRTLQMTQIKNTIPTGTVIAEVSNGCSIPGPGRMAIVRSDDAFAGVRAEEYFGLFSTEATMANYRIAGAPGTDLFGSQDNAKAELLVGAVLTGLTQKVCQEALFGYYLQGETTLTVDWQVFDPLDKKIVFTRTVQGSAKTRVNEHSTMIAVQGARDAFKAATKDLLADPNFVTAVRDPRGGPPASSNELFPEASAPAPAAPATSPTVQIAKLSLNTKEFRDQVSALRDQVVTIRTPGGTGSGFYVAKGLLLTNNHVIQGYSDVKVRFFGGREIDGQVIASNVRRDVAMITTESQAFDGLPLRLEQPPETSPVFVIGSPIGQEHEGSISTGIVSGFRSEENLPYLQSDVGVTNGNSGGPMFDDKGNVIAIVVLVKLNQGQQTHVNYFIPIADALKTLNLDPSLPPGSASSIVAAPAATTAAK